MMMKKRWPMLSVALLMVALLAGFGGFGNARIAHPAEGALYPTPPDIEITLSRFAQARPWRAELNGIDITAEFSPIDLRTLQAAGTDLASYYFDGKNTFVLDTIGGVTTRVFYYDAVGPEIEVTNVTREADFLTISGRARDVSGIASLHVNGVAATLTGKRFSVSLADDALFTFTAVDRLGHVRETQMARPELLLPRVSRLRLSREGLSAAIDRIVEKVSENLALEENLLARNPIIDQRSEIGDLEVSALRIVARSLEVAPADFTLVATPPDRLEGEIVIPNLRATFRVTGHLFANPFSTLVTLETGRLRITPTIVLGVDGAGRLEGEIAGFGSRLLDEILDYGSLPDDLKDTVREAIRETLLDVAASEYRGVLPEAVTGTFAGVAVAEGLAVDGWPFRAELRVATVSVEEGGITFSGLGDFMSERFGDEAPVALGSFYRPVALPPLGEDDGASRLLLSGNLLNRALFASFEAGRLTLTEETSVGAFLQVSGLAQELPRLARLAPDAPMRIRLEPASQPIVVLGEAGIRLDLSGAHLTVEVLPARIGSWSTLLTATVGLRNPLRLEFGEGGIRLLPIGTPAFTFETTGGLPLPESTAARMIGTLLPLFVPDLSDVLSELPFPRFSDLPIRLTAYEIVGDAFLALQGELER